MFVISKIIIFYDLIFYFYFLFYLLFILIFLPSSFNFIIIFW